MPVAPDYIRKAAREALEIRKTVTPSNRAGTLVGLARANQLASGENVSTQTLLRMRSYLLRAKQNYTEARAKGKTIANSKSIMACYLWGGPRALPWVNSELKKIGK